MQSIIVRYHASLTQYKLGEYEKSLEYFTDFIKNIDDFCKNFFDKNEYDTLLEKGTLQITTNNEFAEKSDIELYLDNSLKIFTAIYGANHPFVRDYVTKNIRSKQTNSD